MLETKIMEKLNKLKLVTRKDTVNLPFIHKKNGDSYLVGGYNGTPFVEDSKILLIPFEGVRHFFSITKI